MKDLLFGLSPLLAVALGALLLMLTEAFGRPQRSGDLEPDESDAGSGRAGELGLGAAVVLFAGTIFAGAVLLYGPEDISGLRELQPYLLLDRFAVFIMFALCLGGGLVALLAGGYLPEHQIDRSEFFPLLLLSTVGAMALAAAGDLLTLFIGLEAMSLGAYCLVGLRRNARSTEAALKYFLLGGFASALLLFGAALLYGATGHTDLAGIGAATKSVGATGSVVPAGPLALGSVLVLAGLCFKVAAVPFHMWAPDAYEGAATPTTTFMAIAVKTAAFAALLRVLVLALGEERMQSWGTGWPPALAFLALATMTVGNLIAGRQESIKRMLAYSSIAHAGYILVGVVATMRSSTAQAGVLFYLLAYTISTAGAFGSLILIGRRGAEAVSLEDVAGIGRRHPAAAFAFSLFLLSLAGIPATAGFFGKLYVFRAAFEAELYLLAIGGLANSVIASYYYLRVIVYLFMREPAPGAAAAVPMRSGAVAAALVLAGVLVVYWGLWPWALGDISAAPTAPTLASG